MRALALDFDSRTLALREIAEPGELNSSQVRIRMHYVGVCGTDRELAAFHYGEPPAGERYLVIGHEALGQVVETGTAVQRLTVGEWVVPVVRKSCQPPCANCFRQRRDLCLTGRYTERGIVGAHGFFADWVIEEEADCIRVPPELSLLGVLVEPMSVVEKAIESALRVAEAPMDTALVLGAGTIGILAALALQIRGVSCAVLSVEPAEHFRPGLLRLAGIPYYASPGALDSRRFRMIIEAAGANQAASTGLEFLDSAGVLVVLGAHSFSGPFPLWRFLLNNQTLLGSVNSSPLALELAVQHLRQIDSRILNGMLHRMAPENFAASLSGPPVPQPKVIHILA